MFIMEMCSHVHLYHFKFLLLALEDQIGKSYCLFAVYPIE